MIQPVIAFIFFLGVFSLSENAGAATHSQPTNHAHWDLTDLYISDEAWQLDFDTTAAAIQELGPLVNISPQTAPQLLQALDAISKVRKQAARIYTYASLKSDEDLRSKEGLDKRHKALRLHNEAGQLMTTLSAHLRLIEADRIHAWIASNTDLEKHAHNLKIILTRPNQGKTPCVENTLQTTPRQAFKALQEQTIPWPAIILSDGQAAVLTPAGYSHHRTEDDFVDRKTVFGTYWRTVNLYRESFASTLRTHILNRAQTAKNMGYDSSLEAALAAENIPAIVYENLLGTAQDNLPTLHRFLKLKKRLLGLNTLEYSDIYAPTTTFRPSFTLKDAEAFSLSALEPLGADYTDILRGGFSGQWMHSAPNTGKRSGAYMQDAAYDVHPYILMNFRGSYSDMGTFIHEWGHAVHSVFSQQNNPYETARYTSFLAELVAALNEIMLQNHMIETANNAAEKIYYLTEALETYRTSFFYYAHLAAYEELIHAKIETGEKVSGNMLSQIYLESMRRFFGHDQDIMKIAATYSSEWAMVPHFYDSFHIYKHATAIAGATLLADRFMSETANTREQYRGLLKADGTVSPYRLLRDIEIDLSTAEPYKAVALRMGKLMDTLEETLAQVQE